MLKDSPNSKHYSQVVRHALKTPDLQRKESDLLQDYEYQLHEDDNSWRAAFAHDLDKVYRKSKTKKAGAQPESEFTKQLQARRSPATPTSFLPDAMKADTQKRKGNVPLDPHQDALLAKFGDRVQAKSRPLWDQKSRLKSFAVDSQNKNVSSHLQ